MVRSISSNSRPDTLVQDRTTQPHRFLLQHTAGPYIRVTQDVISVWTYRRSWSAWNLQVLIPGAIIGMGAGTAFASYVSNAAIEVAGGLIGRTFVLYRWLGRWLWPHLLRSAENTSRPHALLGVFWGSLAGLMSLLVNVGTPPYQIHILPRRLEKLTFVGTTVMFFAFMNLMKIGPYFLLGSFRCATLALRSRCCRLRSPRTSPVSGSYAGRRPSRSIASLIC
jgi:uncharacterized membrane protein YfcA